MVLTHPLSMTHPMLKITQFSISRKLIDQNKTVAANSGVDKDPGAVRVLALGGTQRVSGPPAAMLRPPISIAVSVSV